MLFFLLSFFLAIWLFVHNRSVQVFFLKRISAATGCVIDTEEIAFSFENGVKITLNDLSVTSPTKDLTLLVKRVSFTFNFNKIISKRVINLSILCFQPNFKTGLSSYPEGGQEFNLDLVKNSINHFKNDFIKLAHLSIQEGFAKIEKSSFFFDAISLDLFPAVKKPDSFAVNIFFNAEYKNEKASFSLTGSITEDKLENQYCADLKLSTENAPLDWIPGHPVFKVTGGRVSTDIKLAASTNGQISFDGNLIAENFSFCHETSTERKTSIYPKLAANFKGNYSDNLFKISSMKLTGPDFSLSAIFALGIARDPHIALTLFSDFMPLKALKKTFPTPVVDSWIKKSLFPVFNDGRIRYDLFSLNGTVKQLSSLNLPENKNRLILKLSLADMDILAKGENIPFRKVSGDVSIEKNVLVVSGVQGVFGKSIVDNGYYAIDDLAGDNRCHSFAIKGRFTLSDLKEQGKIYFTPEIVKEELNKFITFTGSLNSTIKLHYMESWSYPRIDFLDLQLNNCDIDRKGLILPFFFKEATLGVDGDLKCFVQGNGLWGKSRFKVSGEGEKRWKTGSWEIGFAADADKILKLIDKNSRLKLSAPLPGKLQVVRKKDSWSLNGDLDFDSISIDNGFFITEPLKPGDKLTFNADISADKKIFFKNIRLNKGASSLILSGYWDLMGNIFSDLMVKAEPLFLKDVDFFIDRHPYNTKGTLFGQAKMDGSFQKFSGINLDGKFTGENISFYVANLSSNITDCSFNLDFSKKDVSLSSLRFRLCDNTFNINGLLKGWDGLKGEININSDYVDFANFKFFDSLKIRKESSRFINKSDLKIRMTIKKGVWEKIKFSPVIGNAVFNAGTFNLNLVDLQTKKGGVQIKGYIKSGKYPEFALKSYFDLSEFSLEKILYALKLEEKIIVSRASITTKGFLGSEGDSFDQFIPGLYGKFDFFMENGMITKSNLIFSILNFLSLNNIIDKGKFNFSEKGFPFKKIAGKMKMEKGKLKTDKIFMESPVFNASGKGGVDLVGEKVDIDFWVAPLGTIDRLISIVPFAGYILTGEDRSFITFYLKVNGPFDEYKIRYVPLKHWPSGILGFVTRTLLTPVRILEQMNEIRKIISGSKEKQID